MNTSTGTPGRQSQGPSAKPNVVIVYTDQHRYDALGSSGNSLIRTPNLDRFAAEGVAFSRGYVTCPICLPSRVGLFTGRYNHANLSYTNDRCMLPRETHLCDLFRGAGYYTALIGKDHCFGHHRLDEVFDTVREACHTALIGGWHEAEADVRELRKDKMQVPFADDPIPPERNITGALFREASQFVGERAAAQEPFFLWLSIPDPHPPYMVCEPYASMYDGVELPPPAWREQETADKPYRQQAVVQWNRYDAEYAGDRIDRLRRIYWGMVSYIDDEFGRFMKALADAGLDENTIVLFTADHGDYMGDHRMIRKGPHCYEALVHVPMLARWPGRFRPRGSDAMVSNVDILPTLCELVGLDCPAHVQGESFAGVLLGKADAARSAVFLEHGSPGEPLKPEDLSEDDHARFAENNGHHLCPTIYQGQTKAVRTGRWKYCYTAGDVDELYDLQADPGELHNLAADPAHAAVVREHRDLLLRWMLDTQDTLFA